MRLLRAPYSGKAYGHVISFIFYVGADEYTTDPFLLRRPRDFKKYYIKAQNCKIKILKEELAKAKEVNKVA